MDKEITKFIIEADDQERNELIDFLRQFPNMEGLIDSICESG